MLVPQPKIDFSPFQDIWTEKCLECNCKLQPDIKHYHFPKEEVFVLSCPKCDFTIVIVDMITNDCRNYSQIPEKNTEIMPPSSITK
ncbi:MAG: hypothetical protein U9O98_03075 [Asgard group archaeon]|nr:hypothetical protein [Asgard group archaeon]